jgi:hypothetical protein
VEMLEEHRRGRVGRRQAVSAWEALGRLRGRSTRAFVLWMAFMTVQPPDLPEQAARLLAVFGRQRPAGPCPRGSVRYHRARAWSRTMEGRSSPATGLFLMEAAARRPAETERLTDPTRRLSTVRQASRRVAPVEAWDDDFGFSVSRSGQGLDVQTALRNGSHRGSHGRDALVSSAAGIRCRRPDAPGGIKLP